MHKQLKIHTNSLELYAHFCRTKFVSWFRLFYSSKTVYHRLKVVLVRESLLEPTQPLGMSCSTQHLTLKQLGVIKVLGVKAASQQTLFIVSGSPSIQC